MDKIDAKANMIDETIAYLGTMSIRKLMVRVETLEYKTTTVGSFPHEDSSLGSVFQMKEHIKGLDNAQETIIQMVQMVSKMYEDLSAALRVVSSRTAENQTPTKVRSNLIK